jgi:hypothetical protein
LGEAHTFKVSPRDFIHGQQLIEQSIGLRACAANLPVGLPAQVAASFTPIFKSEQSHADKSIIVQKMQIFVEANVALFIHKCIISELGAEAPKIILLQTNPLLGVEPKHMV